MAHLTQEQRYTIYTMQQSGYKQIEIARSINKDKSVVSRELSRNSDKRSGEYRFDLAVRKHKERQKNKAKHRKFTQEVQEQVDRLLQLDYSPEQVVGTLKKEEKDYVSVERIYQHIWTDKSRGGTLHLHLRRQGRRYRKRGNSKDNRGVIQGRVSIEKRPKVVEQRKRFGDLEVDLIIGKNHNQAIVTINDRATGMLKMQKVMSKEAIEVSKAIVNQLEEWKPYINTITADNGKEFSGHQWIAEQLNIDFYFAHPYHSWERGSNENLNGLIRQYFKKGSDFSLIKDEQILEVQNKLNNRPRKRLSYESPIFRMEKLLFTPKVAFTN